MTVKANTLAVSGSFGWTLTQANGPFSPTEQRAADVSFSVAPNTTTFSLVQAGNTTLAASGSATINLNAYTDYLNVARTAGNTIGVFFKATLANTSNTGGVFRVGPGDTNPAQWFFAGTGNTNTVTLNVNTNGAMLAVYDGHAKAVTNTTCNLKIQNPGTNTIYVQYGIIEGS